MFSGSNSKSSSFSQAASLHSFPQLTEKMLDSLGGKQQQQSSPWFDNISSTVNSNSSVSSGSPPSLSSHLSNSDVLSRPSWLFNSQVRVLLCLFAQ
ncbi:hypothetical protein Aduo_016904 [Ancylostoma duodenale]